MKKKLIGSLLTFLIIITGTSAAAFGEEVPVVKSFKNDTCTKVGYIGASLSDYNIGSAPYLKENLKNYGYDFVFNASSGRSLYSPGTGTDKASGGAIEVIKKFKKENVNCFIIAIGTNDSAELNGNMQGALARIDEAMRAFDGSRVEWIAPVTKVQKNGARYRDTNMEIFREALVKTEKKYPNLHVNLWNTIALNHNGKFWNKDNVHLNEGKKLFAQYAINTLNVNPNQHNPGE